jgi:hypothetical protein
MLDAQNSCNKVNSLDAGYLSRSVISGVPHEGPPVEQSMRVLACSRLLADGEPKQWPRQAQIDRGIMLCPDCKPRP